MSYERRPDRRPGGRPGGGRQDRPPRDRGGYGADRAGPRDRGSYGGDRPPPPRQDRGFGGDRPRTGGFRPRDDEGGMSIRLDPRRLSALKLLAAEAGVRPGELVTSWVEERLDAARAGKSVAAAAAPAALADLSARVDELARRLEELAAGPPVAATPPPTDTGAAQPKRRGRPPKASTNGDAPSAMEPTKAPAARVPLHEEIIAVITERGPMTAAEIAQAITERGRYAPPRSSRPLDAATVNSRVSNPAYRARFVRDGRRIGLANAG
jgi:hypothetical protein